MDGGRHGMSGLSLHSARLPPPNGRAEEAARIVRQRTRLVGVCPSCTQRGCKHPRANSVTEKKKAERRRKKSRQRRATRQEKKRQGKERRGVGRPRGGMKAAARIGERLRREIADRKRRTPKGGRRLAHHTPLLKIPVCVVAACRPPIPPLGCLAAAAPAGGRYGRRRPLHPRLPSRAPARRARPTLLVHGTRRHSAAENRRCSARSARAISLIKAGSGHSKGIPLRIPSVPPS